MTNKLRPADSRYKVGTNIRKWRNMKDVKQKDLAVSLGLSEAAISNIENDITNVTISQLEDISTALEMSIEQLLSDPQENYMRNTAKSEEHVEENLQKQLMQAMISSLQKKDEQLQMLMNLIISQLPVNVIQPAIKKLQVNGV